MRFLWRDYKDAGRSKLMTLCATEFLRRFLLHVLPSGFMRIRHFGLLANRHRKQKLEQCRSLLGVPPPPSDVAPLTIAAIVQQLPPPRAPDIDMIVDAVVARLPEPSPTPKYWDIVPHK